MSVQMSSAVGRCAGSSWRHAFTACSTSSGHSSGTLRSWHLRTKCTRGGDYTLSAQEGLPPASGGP